MFTRTVRSDNWFVKILRCVVFGFIHRSSLSKMFVRIVDRFIHAYIVMFTIWTTVYLIIHYVVYSACRGFFSLCGYKSPEYFSSFFFVIWFLYFIFILNRRVVQMENIYNITSNAELIKEGGFIFKIIFFRLMDKVVRF